LRRYLSTSLHGNLLVHRVQQHAATLETANRELRDFAYVVSHDLKAPLRGIAHLAQWLGEDYGERLDGEGHDMLNMLVGRVKRLENLIEGILEYSRIGRTNTEEEQVDLQYLVPAVIDSLSAPDHIQITITGMLPVIRANPIRILQVFQNLISNAIKFLDKPRGVIMITCEDMEGTWLFRIADNGPGIDTRHHERIFKIFQTLTPRDQRESTGIGLTLVKKIVKLYGGTVGVESTVGEGSTFWFTLPTTPSENPETLKHA
jgi:light-regulated signal transduction histidine kinase (bacteriophytochrome)